jgi:alpha/beta superfamily hydrolase
VKDQGVETIVLAGYSFGAWVCCRLLAERNLFSSVILISPPQKYFDFNWAGLMNAVDLIICGEFDEFCDADEVKKKAQAIHSKFIILPHADHFYAGQEPLLSQQLLKYIHEKKA